MGPEYRIVRARLQDMCWLPSIELAAAVLQVRRAEDWIPFDICHEMAPTATVAARAATR